MPFHNKRLPLHIERSARVTEQFDVTVLPRSRKSKIRKRNLNQPEPYRTFDISYALNVEDETLRELSINLIMDFYNARKGSFASFRFNWIANNQIGHVVTGTQAHNSGGALVAGTKVPQSIGTGNGIDTVFQAVKKYEVGTPEEEEEVIEKLVDGTPTLFFDGVEQVGGFTADTDRGTITLDAPAGIGVDVGLYSEFDFPVIFSADVTLEMVTNSSGRIQGITLEQVSGEFL